ncbi:MAG: 3-methyl-2-oxobutanoate dehydrogenase subunit VorB [Clostridiales bacterium]|jgi:2-oxoglutarate ferredoxin oxidoreductase subunit alpha|nr:3-methyl-2-oxobutanoate dehydrogenase subunit VorB [Clostridiales bacterium]
MEKVLMKGNEAFAEAAIRGGAGFYFGYPITPQNEIPEYMSHELEKAGGSFIQAESELAAVNMAYGAAAAGGSVFISTSSPGVALMQEGISFMCSSEVPVVMLNVSRGGPGVGGIQPGQADYFQATRGGGNGDYHVPVFAPASIQEAIDMIYGAFEIADKYQNPVMILADGMLGQMMEPVSLPEAKRMATYEEIRANKPWAITGKGPRSERNVIKSLRLQPDVLEAHIHRLFEKYDRMEKELVRYETYGEPDPEIVFVAFGTVARLVAETMDILAERGYKAGMIRPVTLWPFPFDAFARISDKTRLVVSVELSMGQLLTDVKAAVCGRVPVGLINRTGGVVPTPVEIADRAIKQLKALD